MRWSHLQREIYKLLDDTLDLQIQCRAYRMPKSHSTNPQIPRYWITLGKEIIWDFPTKEDDRKYLTYLHIPLISDLIRQYIDSPRAGLAKRKFEADFYGITDILKAADRRIGKKQWENIPQSEAVKKILDKRKRETFVSRF